MLFLPSGTSCDHSGGEAAAIHFELTLPRVWSARVQELGLSEEEQLAWEQTRSDLAAAQGIELDDASASHQTLHRLLGYPDERRGDMPLTCELVARGFDLRHTPPWSHPEAERLARFSIRWRLLLQLTANDERGWGWGSNNDRLYFWIDERDLLRSNVSRVWAIRR